METFDLKKLYQHVEKTLSPHRYTHTLGVVETAIILAKRENVDTHKTEVAALLHDVAKSMDLETLQKYIHDEKILEIYGNLGELLHGFAGSNFAKEKLGITDITILDAIKYHTVGRRNMTKLDKIIYIADAIEPNRQYPSVEEIREKINTSINDAILYEINCKLRHLLDINAIIHPNTVDLRNGIMEEIKQLMVENS